MKYAPFSRFETMARRLVEGSFNRLFGGRLEPLEVAGRLARALEDKQVDGQAPDHFRVYLHPDDYKSISRQTPDLAGELAGYVMQLAQQAGLALAYRPEIELVADPALSRQQVRVEAEHNTRPDGTTQVFSHHAPTPGMEIQAAIQAVDAFLIVDGRRHVALDRPLITLGRRTDNDVVLDSPTVSRRHAQIRWRYGHFVIYDLSGRERTVVNGQAVTEYVLQPGDVIALSNVLIIYGEGRENLRRTLPDGDNDDDVGETLLKPPPEP